MKESYGQPSKDLQIEWEQKLKASGLPTASEIKENEEIQINDRATAEEALEAGYVNKQHASISEILNDTISDSSLLQKFSDLTENMQNGIIADIEALRDKDATDWEVVQKLRSAIDRDSSALSTKMAEFGKLTSEDSDKNYKPKLASDEKRWAEESNKEDEIIKEKIDKLIEKLREIKEKGKEAGDSEEPEADDEKKEQEDEKPKWVN